MPRFQNLVVGDLRSYFIVITRKRSFRSCFKTNYLVNLYLKTQEWHIFTHQFMKIWKQPHYKKNTYFCLFLLSLWFFVCMYDSFIIPPRRPMLLLLKHSTWKNCLKNLLFLLFEENFKINCPINFYLVANFPFISYMADSAASLYSSPDFIGS